MSSGQTYGFHNPKLTTEFFKFINENSKLKFEDSSWKHDLTDSVYNEEKDIYIYLPNSTEFNFDKEEFNTFQVVYNRETNIDKAEYVEFQTIEEVVDEINKKF